MLSKTQVNLKLIPGVDGSAEICQLVGYNLTDIVVKGSWRGPARLHLVPHVNAPVAAVASMEIRPSIPLRIIGLETASGFSSVGRGLWPFGISTGVIDRLRAVRFVERHPTLEYLPMTAPEAPDQIVSGIFSLEGGYRWMSRSAVVVLKAPAAERPLRVAFTIHPKSPARHVALPPVAR